MTSGKEEESREMEQPENQAAARNGQYAHTVLNRAAEHHRGRGPSGAPLAPGGRPEAGRPGVPAGAPGAGSPGAQLRRHAAAGGHRGLPQGRRARTNASLDRAGRVLGRVDGAQREVAGVLREAAPEIARRAREWTLRVSPAMRKLAAMEITGGELSEIIRQARSG